MNKPDDDNNILAEFMSSYGDNILSDKSKQIRTTAWFCKKCDHENKGTDWSCVSCGHEPLMGRKDFENQRWNESHKQED